MAASAEAATAPLLKPLQPTRTAVAAAAARGLLARAAEAVVCSFLRAAWLLNAATAAFIALRRACGEDSRAAAVAWDVFTGALVATGLLFYPAAPLLLWSVGSARRKAEAREIGGGGERPDEEQGISLPQSTGERGRQDRAQGLFIALFFVFWGLVTVGMLMLVLAPDKKSFGGSIGYMLADIGCFCCSVMFCIVYLQQLIQPRAIYAKLLRGAAGLH